MFFESMPADSGLGFVVVLHLSADRKSLLTEIIGRWTEMPVSEAENNELVEPDRVYVIPPGYVATLQQGRLRLRHLASDVPREATPIDQFFDSLAADLGESAIGIVLSGTGHDGALGLKAIKARGGLTLAQGTDGLRAPAQRHAEQRHCNRGCRSDRPGAGHASAGDGRQRQRGTRPHDRLRRAD